MQHKPIPYEIEDSPTMLQEPVTAYARYSQSVKRKVSSKDLMAEGFITLEQSKALIEEKIHKFFHS